MELVQSANVIKSKVKSKIHKSKKVLSFYCYFVWSVTDNHFHAREGKYKFIQFSPWLINLNGLAWIRKHFGPQRSLKKLGQANQMLLAIQSFLAQDNFFKKDSRKMELFAEVCWVGLINSIWTRWIGQNSDLEIEAALK